MAENTGHAPVCTYRSGCQLLKFVASVTLCQKVLTWSWSLASAFGGHPAARELLGYNGLYTGFQSGGPHELVGPRNQKYRQHYQSNWPLSSYWLNTNEIPTGYMLGVASKWYHCHVMLLIANSLNPWYLCSLL